MGCHAAVAAQILGCETVQRVLRREMLTPREWSFWTLVDASLLPQSPEQKAMVMEAANILGVEATHDAMTVIALFRFYNTFVDLHGVDAMTTEGYNATGDRLATSGYVPPARKE